MSVPKSRRKDAQVQFIQDALNLRRRTIHIVKKFPKSYRWIITNNLLELATKIFRCSIEGNAVYMHSKMDAQDFAFRRRCFVEACSAADAMSAEITFCHELLMEGENIFRDMEDRERKFEIWIGLCVSAKNRLKALIKSDKERYEAWRKGAG